MGLDSDDEVCFSIQKYHTHEAARVHPARAPNSAALNESDCIKQGKLDETSSDEASDSDEPAEWDAKPLRTVNRSLDITDAVRKKRKMEKLVGPTLKSLKKQLKPNGYDIMWNKVKLGSATCWGPTLASTAFGCAKHGLSKCRIAMPSKKAPSKLEIKKWLIAGQSMCFDDHFHLGKQLTAAFA